jgi:hypothetical protein
MNPLAWARLAAANASRVSASVLTGYRPARRGEGAAGQQPRPCPPRGQPDDGAEHQLVADQPNSGRTLSSNHGVGGCQGDQDDHRRVVERRFGFQRGPQLGTQRQPAQNREHCGRVGRGHDRAEQHRGVLVQAENPVRGLGCHRHAGGDTDGGQHEG